MAYGFVMDVPAPTTFYDALHAEIMSRAPDGGDGLLVHVSRATPEGFQVTEVWESREQCERFTVEVVGPAMAHLTQGQPPQVAPAPEEFEPRGLVVPSAHVLV